MKEQTIMLTQMIPQFPPVWAEVFGEDDYGIFAQSSLEGERFVWRWICPGTFMMGCDPEYSFGRPAEKPQHKVTLTRGFWLGETPVTQGQWMSVMGFNPTGRIWDDWRHHPIERVTWHHCWEFAAKVNEHSIGLNARLPTEAQWEYACRAGKQTGYNDGSPCTESEGRDRALERLGWFDDNSGRVTHPVKRKAANAWGLYDMHGNVCEWCADVWQENAYENREAGVVNPFVDLAEESAKRVIRGGSYGSDGRNCRSASRDWAHSDSRSGNRGFRLVAGQELGGGATGKEIPLTQVIPPPLFTPRLSAEQIADAKQRLALRHPVHQHDDCIRIAYEWLDAQNRTKNITKTFHPLKHLIEKWAGRYISDSDVEVAAELHPEIIGKYSYYNISSLLTEPSLKRLDGIGEAMKHGYRDLHDPKKYSWHEDDA